MTRDPDALYRELADALSESPAPPCTDDPRFILDAADLAPNESTHLGFTICIHCPVKPQCIAYADAARPFAGVWGGRTYPAPIRDRR